MTFGATERLCAAPPPASVEETLQARPDPSDLPLVYREDIYHPAMTDPLVTRGTFDLGRGDTLIRRQTAPRVEETEIGSHFITIRRQDYENNVLIPDQIAPLLTLLRDVVLGREIDTASYSMRLQKNDAGWVTTLSPARDTGELSLSGCGNVLHQMTLGSVGGERRIIVFTPQP